MKRFQYWLAWVICFIVGYASMRFQGAPGWGAIIGGWVMAFGILGKQPNA